MLVNLAERGRKGAGIRFQTILLGTMLVPRRGWQGERSSGHRAEATTFGSDDTL